MPSAQPKAKSQAPSPYSPARRRRNGGATGRRSRIELIERARSRVLVLAPAAQLGPVADAPGRDVVEVDLDDELGAQADPLEVLAGAPAARVGGAALARLIVGEEAGQATLLVG